jgi:2-polyprenyl-3-methyl-5-hydroxy-6-metoxy-1,4-benzoquinol methylase
MNTQRFFMDLVAEIGRQNPMQMRALDRHISSLSPSFLKMAEDCTSALLNLPGNDLKTLAGFYLTLCKEMLTEQVKFKRTGRYSATHAADVNQALYSSDDAMRGRVYALGLSQFLWPNHSALFQFFLETNATMPTVQSYLEVGPGHGFHLAHAANQFPKATMSAVDISPSSLQISKAIFNHLLPNREVQLHLADIGDAQSYQLGTYDYVVINEVLEHLDHPEKMLRDIANVLNPDGRLFITTCANAPAIDHVYLYPDVDSIRVQLRSEGYEILDECVCPVGDVPPEDWTKKKTEVNYSAILKRKTP